MPFQDRLFRQFTQTVIVSMRPHVGGVYGIFCGAMCIYIGQSENIREAMLRHVTGRSLEAETIHRSFPTSWVYEALQPERRDARELQLLNELDPVCNRM